MTPYDTLLADDPLWLIALKAAALLALLLGWTVFNIWFERRVLARMQNRKGPNMAGPFGLAQGLADGIKLFFKEDFRPAKTDRLVFNLAPFLVGVAAFTMWSVLPLGGPVSIFGEETLLQVTDFPVSLPFVLAMGSVGIYGLVLGGWASNGTYSLLGSMRATAQMISYQVAMGLSLAAVFIHAGSMSAGGVVAAQQAPIALFGGETPLRGWYAALLLPSFITYVISMFGETNRLPFDLAECESELVSGHLTDYSGFRYALFFLAEYINMTTVSAVATTLFLGGYHAPWPFDAIANGAYDQGWWGLLWFVLKVQLLIFLFVWVRASVPRFRYDQFMSLGWKVLIPANLVWLFAMAVFRGLRLGRSLPLIATASIVTALVLASVAVMMVQDRMKEQAERSPTEIPVPPDESGGAEPEPEPEPEPFDAFAGGYPVPPKPGEQLPELAGFVPATLTVMALSDRRRTRGGETR
ncbi:MAG: NADH-quinone oxidoreductase subunit NuoH [Propionibacteriaceae bacterium]|jgi:NADH-quinone oxidoreductase subunit H|nr:NADH-quinone oxidoreductase subunit NuoH [Propionibacteriaceae bacterium]